MTEDERKAYDRQYYLRNKAKYIAKANARNAKLKLEDPEGQAEKQGAACRKWHAKNKDTEAIRNKAYRMRNREREAERDRAYKAANYDRMMENIRLRRERMSPERREELRVIARKRYRDNPAPYIMWARMRDQHIHKNAALDLGEYHDDMIKEIYVECPQGHHVDHIFPLKGKTCWGLHVAWNLQHLPAEDNLKKRNKIPQDVSPLAFVDAPWSGWTETRRRA